MYHDGKCLGRISGLPYMDHRSHAIDLEMLFGNSHGNIG